MILYGLRYEAVDVKGVADESSIAEVDILRRSDPIHVQNIVTGHFLPELIDVIYHLVQTPIFGGLVFI